MDFETLKEKIRAAKLYPIHVASGPLDEDEGDTVFLGTLEEYFDAVRAVGAPVVLVSTEIFDEERFWYLPEDVPPEEQGEDTEEKEIESIDLCSIVPALRDFKNRIGQIAIHKLSAALPKGSLDFFINEAWWTEFSEQSESAKEKVDDNLDAAAAKSRAAQESKQKEALNALKALIRDPDFVRLPTQKAMLAYAADKIPELEVVDDYDLRAEIQDLHARIKARGLDRKR